jgi:hypothetical protein
MTSSVFLFLGRWQAWSLQNPRLNAYLLRCFARIRFKPALPEIYVISGVTHPMAENICQLAKHWSAVQVPSTLLDEETTQADQFIPKDQFF